MAQPGQDPPARQVVLEEQVGVVAPLGKVGLALDVDVVPWLSVQAGVGTDVFGQDENCTDSGITYYEPGYPGDGRRCNWSIRNFAAMVRLRYPVLGARTLVSFGLGISHNANPAAGDLQVPVYREDNELSLEHRFEGGLRLRAFTGLGFYLDESHLPAFGGSVYYGAAVGYAVWPNPEVPPERSLSLGSWYGWEPLAADVSAAVMLGLGGGVWDAPGTRAALATYGLSGPLAHFAHRRYGRAILSTALRSVLPYLFSRGNYQISDGGYFIDPIIPIVASAVIAALVDDLSWQPER